MQRPDAEHVRELLKSIVDACGDGIVVSDGNGLITTLNNARPLLKLVNQLLDISMIGSGSQKMIYEKRDLKKYVAAILDSFGFIAQSKKIMLSFAADEGLSAVHSDPAKLEF